MKPSFEKYIPFKQINLPDRQWPNNTITKAPIWCSVDLRDGNQALVDPMNLEEKLEFFHALCDMGFKEIEIGFPSASETEYEICRELIENNHIPDDVTIQVLVQAREHLIRKTFEAVKGAKNVIVHFYNSTSTLQRKVVFKTDMQGVIDIAVKGAKLIYELTEEEQNILRRGKNASKASVAKHATAQEYRASTGFECLLGWLHLMGRDDRIEELFETIWKNYTPEQ